MEVPLAEGGDPLQDERTLRSVFEELESIFSTPFLRAQLNLGK